MISATANDVQEFDSLTDTRLYEHTVAAVGLCKYNISAADAT